MAVNFRSWDDRIKRAGELSELYSSSRSVLLFYRELLVFQKDLWRCFMRQMNESNRLAQARSLFNDSSIGSSIPFLLPHFPSFLSLVKQAGSPELAQRSHRLAAAGEDEWAKLIESYWEEKSDLKEFIRDLTLLFFPKALLQPYAEALSAVDPQKDGREWPPPSREKTACPRCGSLPQLGILRTEGEGAKRSLLCCLCATEWRHKRLCCPSCGEEDFARLFYHRALDFPHVRVEACESCKKYIKSIDLTVDGRAVPIVDEIATLPLDVWAAGQGYSKLEMNLLGI